MMKYQTLIAALGLATLLGAAPSLAQVRPEQIREHMVVNGSDGVHVGVVDKVEKNDIVLAKNDPRSGGQHHELPLTSVASVTENKVKLKMSAKEALRQWNAEPRPAGDPKR